MRQGRTRVAGLWLAGAAALLCLAQCEQTGVVVRPADDAGAASAASLEYTPAGCDYVVRSPVLMGVAMSSPAVGPTPTVDHVHVSWAGPTPSTFAVNWRSDRETLVTEVLYGTSEAAVAAAGDATDGVRKQVGHTFEFLAASGETTRIHEAHVCGLEPATRYFYKVGGMGSWSRVFDVTTGPTVGSTGRFRFAVTGDSRNDAMIWAEVQAKVRDTQPAFQLFSGDAVILGANQFEWNAWFEAEWNGVKAEDVLARTPFMFANGNHDGLTINYISQFAFPQEVSPEETGTGESWYSFNYGNAHFTVLNDSLGPDLEGGAHRDWIEADFRAVDRSVTPWLIVLHHRPMYSCATNHGSDTVLRASWQPVFDQYDVDLVLNGHDHDYERSKPIRGFQSGTNDGVLVPMNEGTIYVVAAGAGAPLYGVDTSCFHTERTESVRNYVTVDIEGDTLTLNAYRLDGTPLDNFTLQK